MQTNPTDSLRPEKTQLSPHDSSMEAEDASIDAGAAENVQKKGGEDGNDQVQPQRISREAAEKGIPPDADPDDPVSP